LSTTRLKGTPEEATGAVFSADVSPEELKVFIEEADEQIALLDRDLVRLETEGDDPELIQEIFRATHTMKGSSAMLGYPRMSELAHAMESLLDALRSGKISVSAEIVDSLLYGLDILKVLRDALVSPEKRPTDIRPAVARLESAAEMAGSLGSHAGDREGTPPAAAKQAVAAAADHEQARNLHSAV
jgi:two-component system chemotaxis sensor kinase CheA